MLLTWTDDLPYFGTDQMVEWFERESVQHLPLTFEPVCRDFIGIEVKQDLVRGITLLSQSRYWTLAGERFAEYLTPPYRASRTPLPERCNLVVATEAEVREAAHLPYRQILGCIAFPSCHTKLENKHAISVLSRHMQAWSVEHWKVALHCLK